MRLYPAVEKRAPLVDGFNGLPGPAGTRSIALKWALNFSAAARKKKVSNHQFRSRYEWYAEAYATYYDLAGAKRADALGLQLFDPRRSARSACRSRTTTRSPAAAPIEPCATSSPSVRTSM